MAWMGFVVLLMTYFNLWKLLAVPDTAAGLELVTSNTSATECTHLACPARTQTAVQLEIHIKLRNGHSFTKFCS